VKISYGLRIQEFLLGTFSLLNKEKVPGAITLHQTIKLFDLSKKK